MQDYKLKTEQRQMSLIMYIPYSNDALLNIKANFLH